MSERESLMAIAREEEVKTLYTRVEHLELQLQKAFALLENLDAHHIRLSRVEREVGLLP